MFNLVKEFLSKYRYSFCCLFISSIISSILTIINPYLFGRYIDVLISLKSKNTIYTFTVILAMVSIASVSISYVKNIMMAKFKNKIVFELTNKVFNHLRKLPLSYFRNNDATYLNDRINTDCNEIVSFIIDTTLNACVYFISIVLYIVILSRINFNILFIVLMFMPLYVMLYYIFKKPMYRENYKYKEIRNQYYSHMNDQISKVKFVKINALFEEFSKLLSYNFDRVYKQIIKTSRIGFLFMSLDSIIDSILIVILVLCGGFLILDKKLTVGEFTVIENYFSSLLACITFYLKIGQSYQYATTSFNRLEEILGKKVEINGENKLENINTLEVANLTFKYEDTELFSNLSITFEKGKLYCIVGNNGVGKSTLINIILGLIQNYKGTIKYNSIDIKKLDLYYLRSKLISVVEQPVTLINSTIYDNLSCGINNSDKNYVNMQCKKSNLLNFITSIPNGYNYSIDEKSSNISGGEKEKIALTRAFIKNSDVLILDEPSTGLDLNSVECLKDNLLELKKNKIIIVITHEKKLEEISDCIVKL